jgi:hypothetical protein
MPVRRRPRRRPSSGAVPQRGPYVAGRELRVLGEESLWRDALSDEPDDGGNRNPRTGDARHAAHDPVIDHHSVGFHDARLALATPERMSAIRADGQAMDAKRDLAEHDDCSGVEVVGNDVEVVQDQGCLFSRPLIRCPAHEQERRRRRA